MEGLIQVTAREVKTELHDDAVKTKSIFWRAIKYLLKGKYLINDNLGLTLTLILKNLKVTGILIQR